MLGLYTDFVPRHAKQYAQMGCLIQDALGKYAAEVKDGTFPTQKESVDMDEAILKDLTGNS